MSEHPPALPHGTFAEVFPGVHLVTGAMKMGTGMWFDRNMTAVVHDGDVVLFNTLRLDDAGLAALDVLGTVTDVVRLGAHHGRDDAFYAERYGARVWAPQGCSRSLSPTALEDGVELPIPGAQVFLFKDLAKPEAIVRLDQDGGILISCDALQNWSGPHPEYSSLMARTVMRLMGFFAPTQIGPAWAKSAKPQAACFERLQLWDYENVVPAHGPPVKGRAKTAYAASIARRFPSSEAR